MSIFDGLFNGDAERLNVHEELPPVYLNQMVSVASQQYDHQVFLEKEIEGLRQRIEKLEKPTTEDKIMVITINLIEKENKCKVWVGAIESELIPQFQVYADSELSAIEHLKDHIQESRLEVARADLQLNDLWLKCPEKDMPVEKATTGSNKEE